MTTRSDVPMPVSRAALMPTNAPDQSTTISPSARWARRLEGVRIGGDSGSDTIRRDHVAAPADHGGAARRVRRRLGAARTARVRRRHGRGVGVATGSPATWAGVVLLNRGAVPLTLSPVEPVSARPRPEGGRRPGARARRRRRRDRRPEPVGERPGLSRPTHPGVPVAGTVLEPVVAADERPIAEVLVGLVADRPGRYVLSGLRMRYVVGGGRAGGHADACGGHLRESTPTTRPPERARRRSGYAASSRRSSIAAIDADVAAAEPRVEPDPVLGQHPHQRGYDQRVEVRSRRGAPARAARRRGRAPAGRCASDVIAE